MLELAGDLGLEQEPGAAPRVVGQLGPDLLQGDLAIQLGVDRHADQAEAAPAVRPDDPEPRSARVLGLAGAGDGVGRVLGGGFLAGVWAGRNALA